MPISAQLRGLFLGLPPVGSEKGLKVMMFPRFFRVITVTTDLRYHPDQKKYYDHEVAPASFVYNRSLKPKNFHIISTLNSLVFTRTDLIRQFLE
ncbi:MAG: hypothetical protein AAB691_01225 [Patescibacteria group bacterium]